MDKKPENKTIKSANKILVKDGEFEVGIESTDESTESIINMAVNCLAHIKSAGRAETEERSAKEETTTTDLDSQKEYEKLMDAL